MNVPNKLPKSVQPRAKADLRDIWMAESRADAEKAFDRFLAQDPGPSTRPKTTRSPIA
jgi:hypothetical protein